MVGSKGVDFAQLRIDVTALAHKQAELRDKLRSYLSKTDKPVGTLAREAGIPWVGLNSFLNGERVLASGKGLRQLATILEADQLGNDIVELGAKIADRYIGLASTNQQVIDIVLDLLDEFGSRPAEYTMAEFAGAFAGNEALVLGALQCSKRALAELSNQPAKIAEILDQLLDDQIDARLQEAKAAQMNKRSVKVEEVERLVEALLPAYSDKASLVRELRLSRGSFDRANLVRASDAQLDGFIATLSPLLEAQQRSHKDVAELQELYQQLYAHFGSQHRVARELDVASSTLSDAIHGKSGSDTVSGILASGKKRLKELESASPDQDAVPTKASAPPTKGPAMPDPFGGLAGGMHGDVPYVLTADTFRRIQGVQVAALIDGLIASLRITRAYLNLIAQLRGEEARSQVRQHAGLNHELNEFRRSDELAASAHPEALFGPFDRQREQEAAVIYHPHSK